MKNMTFFLAMLVLSGCATTTDGRQPISMSGIAARLKCDADKITLTDIGDSTTRRADGCGKSETYTQIGDAYTGSWVPMQDLKARAAFDFNCPKEKLEIIPITTGRQMGASGCGQRAVYTYIQIARSQHDWVMDSSRK